DRESAAAAAGAAERKEHDTRAARRTEREAERAGGEPPLGPARLRAAWEPAEVGEERKAVVAELDLVGERQHGERPVVAGEKEEIVAEQRAACACEREGERRLPCAGRSCGQHSCAVQREAGR